MGERNGRTWWWIDHTDHTDEGWCIFYDRNPIIKIFVNTVIILKFRFNKNNEKVIGKYYSGISISCSTPLMIIK